MGNTGNVTAVFLQARLDSSRLPRKAVLKIAGKMIIQHAMEALKEVDADVHVLLTDRESYPPLSEYAAACGFDTFAGPKDDVLARFVLAADKYRAETIIRATGDNPLVSPVLAKKICALHVLEQADYSGFLGIPLGTGVEVLNAESLREAYAHGDDPYEREHVSPYLYRREERFSILRPQAETKYCFPEGRVTLDTQEDFRYLTSLYDELYQGEPIPTEKIVPWLKSHHPVMV